MIERVDGLHAMSFKMLGVPSSTLTVPYQCFPDNHCCCCMLEAKLEKDLSNYHRNRRGEVPHQPRSSASGHDDMLISVGNTVVVPVIMYDDASYYYANYEAPSPQQQNSKKTVHKRKQSLLEQPSVNNVPRAPHLGLPISDESLGGHKC